MIEHRYVTTVMILNKDSLNDYSVRKILGITGWNRALKIGDFVNIIHKNEMCQSYQITEIGDKIYFATKNELKSVGYLCIYHLLDGNKFASVYEPMVGFIINGTEYPTPSYLQVGIMTRIGTKFCSFPIHDGLSTLGIQLEQNPKLNDQPKFNGDPEIKLSLSGNRDVDIRIFLYLSDRDAYVLSQVNRAMAETFNTDELWRLRTDPDLIKYKEKYAGSESWKEFYKMTREFPYPCKELIKWGNQDFILDLILHNDQKINDTNIIKRWLKNLIEYGQYKISKIFQDYSIKTFPDTIKRALFKNDDGIDYISTEYIDNYEYLFTLDRDILYETLQYISDTYGQGSINGQYLFPVLFYGKHCDVLEWLISAYNNGLWVDSDRCFSKTIDYSDRNFDREVIDLILDATNSFHLLCGHDIAQAAETDNMDLVEYLVKSIDTRFEKGDFHFDYYGNSNDSILAFCLAHDRIDLYGMVIKHYSLCRGLSMKEI